MTPAEAIAALARLLAAGLTLREALERWAEHVPGRDEIERAVVD